MAYEEFQTAEAEIAPEQLDAIESLRAAVQELSTKVTSLISENEQNTEQVAKDVAQSRRELVQTRTMLARLQTRFDSQLTVIVLSNIASGAGVAALMLVLTNALR